MEELLNKEVMIYPGDTYKKYGILREITTHGMLFEITRYDGNDNQYVVGKKTFIGIGSKLTFREV